jgi:hypothetical protein
LGVEFGGGGLRLFPLSRADDDIVAGRGPAQGEAGAFFAGAAEEGEGGKFVRRQCSSPGLRSVGDSVADSSAISPPIQEVKVCPNVSLAQGLFSGKRLIPCASVFVETSDTVPMREFASRRFSSQRLYDLVDDSRRTLIAHGARSNRDIRHSALNETQEIASHSQSSITRPGTFSKCFWLWVTRGMAC